MSGEFKVMHFTSSSNLLSDFPNEKYMFKKKKKIHVKKRATFRPVFYPLKMTRFDP